MHAGSQTLLKIIASNDNTVLTAQVARDDREITAMCPVSSFNWTRVSGDAEADAAWNASHAGMKQIALLPADMASDVQITCTYSETEGSYGTMQVDEALMASHTPAMADANDVFALVDGDLVVTTASENGTDYVLEDDTLTVNSGFTGTISATAAFSSGEQDVDAENIFGLHFENAAHADSQPLLRIVAANENTALEAHVVRGGREITAEYPASQFNWTRVSGDAAADAAWNASHAGMKQIALMPADTVSGVEFRCTYSEIEGSYGTVQVDGAMTAYHTPAVEDANDAFALVDGVLTVTTDSENGSDYAVDGNTLIVNSGFTGTITSTVTVTDGARTREIDFIYDHNGLRTGKVVTEGEKTETTEYTLHGKLIMHMTKRSVDEYGAETVQNLHFFYDAQSRPAFVEYNGTKYRYLHNLQGDIVGIVDGNGTLVVEYKYDAWGKPILTIGSMADTLGKQNPFRYRGYAYDEEAELYYLRSRYYNPVLERFANADTRMGKNLYAYCSNVPVICSDSDGFSPSITPSPSRTENWDTAFYARMFAKRIKTAVNRAIKAVSDGMKSANDSIKRAVKNVAYVMQAAQLARHGGGVIEFNSGLKATCYTSEYWYRINRPEGDWGRVRLDAGITIAGKMAEKFAALSWLAPYIEGIGLYMFMLDIGTNGQYDMINKYIDKSGSIGWISWERSINTAPMPTVWDSTTFTPLEWFGEIESVDFFE